VARHTPGGAVHLGLTAPPDRRGGAEDDEPVVRLDDDHANAGRLARGISAAGWEVEAPQTNMVFVKVARESCASLQAHLAAAGVVAVVTPRTRLVTHLDVDAGGVDQAVAAFASFNRSPAVAG